MVISMTGFAAVCDRAPDASSEVVAEIRCVNHRHAKIVVRVGSDNSQLEALLESLVRETVVRGAVTLQVRITAARDNVRRQLDTSLLETLYTQLVDCKARLGITTPTTLESLLVLPEIIADTTQHDLPELKENNDHVVATVQRALEQMQAMRRREGEAMANHLRSSAAELKQFVDKISEKAPHVPELYRQRLSERVASLLTAAGGALRETDVVREVALMADRCDITEELVRWRSHLEQFDLLLNRDSDTGRPLDFLLQEMFRETNTIGAKANDLEITRRVVAMKATLEKMREIVQNVE